MQDLRARGIAGERSLIERRQARRVRRFGVRAEIEQRDERAFLALHDRQVERRPVVVGAVHRLVEIGRGIASTSAIATAEKMLWTAP